MPLDGSILLDLTLAFLGSVTILIPDIPYVRTAVMPDDEISRLRTAQQTLFADHELTDDDTGFTALIDVLTSVTGELPATPYEIRIADDRNRDNTVVQIRYNEPEADHAYATAFAGHPAQVTLLVDEHIRELRQNVRHWFLMAGVTLLATGFGLRATVYAWRLWG